MPTTDPMTPDLASEPADILAEWANHRLMLNGNILGRKTAKLADQLAAEVKRLRAELARRREDEGELAGFLATLVKSVEQQRKAHVWDWTDHACEECVLHSDCLIPGFRCGYHAAKNALAALALPTPNPGE